MMFPTILIVDDEESILQSLGGILSDEGYELLTAVNGYEALKIIETESPDIVLLDVWMPGIDGIDTLKEIKKADPSLPVIIITGHGNIETAVNATKIGAFDFLEKPLSIDKVIVSINNALNFRRLEEENRHLKKKAIEKHTLTGNSPTVGMLKLELMNIAATDSSVLIMGENGTGKELVARSIHQLSERSEAPLMAVNCATLSEENLEATLFGHEKDAVEGGGSKKRGSLEMAANGTIFLDEVGNISLSTQAKLLRVLEQKQFRRLGGSRDIDISARIIASTNKNLEQEIKDGNFREDLYFRLNVIPVNVPPLRERIEDLPELVNVFFTKCSETFKLPKKNITEEALAKLAQYNWPGNVRELKNLVERLATLVEGDTIDIPHLPSPYNGKDGDGEGKDANLFSYDNLKDAVRAFETEFISRKLNKNKNEIKPTAKEIGVKPDYIKKVLEKTETQGK